MALPLSEAGGTGLRILGTGSGCSNSALLLNHGDEIIIFIVTSLHKTSTSAQPGGGSWQNCQPRPGHRTFGSLEAAWRGPGIGYPPSRHRVCEWSGWCEASLSKRDDNVRNIGSDFESRIWFCRTSSSKVSVEGVESQTTFSQSGTWACRHPPNTCKRTMSSWES